MKFWTEDAKARSTQTGSINDVTEFSRLHHPVELKKSWLGLAANLINQNMGPMVREVSDKPS